MTNISGTDNEYEFIKYLNNKKISELNPMFKNLINTLFPSENNKSNIKCWKNQLKDL